MSETQDSGSRSITTLRVTKNTREDVYYYKLPEETYDDAVQRLLDEAGAGK